MSDLITVNVPIESKAVVFCSVSTVTTWFFASWSIHNFTGKDCYSVNSQYANGITSITTSSTTSDIRTLAFSLSSENLPVQDIYALPIFTTPSGY